MYSGNALISSLALLSSLNGDRLRLEFRAKKTSLGLDRSEGDCCTKGSNINALEHPENIVEDPAKTFGYASNGSRPDSHRQGLDFRRVADTVPGCILVADTDGKVLYANKGFVAALGRPLEELLGEGWLESVEPAFLGEARAKWYPCIRARVRWM
jgi:PAS domain-containing protein